MAIVTRYFSTTSAGAANGTSWADRAALFSSGNWSSVITGFNFSGSDSLLALIGPGTYSCGQSLASGLFSNAPTAANPLLLHGCDSAGSALAPPNSSWTSDQPAWDTTGMAWIVASANIAIVGLSSCFPILLNFRTSAGTTNPIVNSTTPMVVWCQFEHSNAHASASGCTANVMANCCVTMSGATYSTAASASVLAVNCRFVGNGAASSGNRYGWASSGATPKLIGCTFFSHPGGGVVSTSTSTAFQLVAQNNVIDRCGGNGIDLISTASQTAASIISQSCITNVGGYGVNASASNVITVGNRLRDNTSGNFNSFGNYPMSDNDISSGSDADEFVDASSGDYRIKYGSALWGKGYGVSDEPAPTGGGGRRPRLVTVS